MTLRQLRESRRELFYSQVWYLDQAFMDIQAGYPLTKPTKMGPQIAPPSECKRAVDLAMLYTRYPKDPMWQFYLWTCDFDDQGQRVYVGDNGKGFEIHRHLRLTERWRVPLWS